MPAPDASMELLPPGLSLGQVQYDAAEAAAILARGAETLRTLGRANVFCRIVLGRQLLVIRDQQLWTRIRVPASQQDRGGAPFHSWDDFMRRGFPHITGLSAETGYAAAMLAKADVLKRLPEPELRKFENLANAILLVRLERKGLPITPELISAAQTMPVKEFRQMTGGGKKAMVEAVMESSEAARELQAIVAILKSADAGALAALHAIFDQAMSQAGSNPTDAVDCVVAACMEQWRQEQQEPHPMKG